MDRLAELIPRLQRLGYLPLLALRRSGQLMCQKLPGSVAPIPVIEPLRSILNKQRRDSGFILAGTSGNLSICQISLAEKSCRHFRKSKFHGTVGMR